MGEEWVVAVFRAVRSGDVDAVETLLDEAPDGIDARDDAGVGLLHVAAERNDVPMAELLVQRGADPEVEAPWGQTPFEWAANMNAPDVARFLLGRGGQRLNLWTAAALGLSDDVSRYVGEDGSVAPEAGRHPRPGANLDGWTEETAFLRGDHLDDAMYIACRNGQEEVARFLRGRGASVEARGYFGAPLLHWTAAGGHASLVEWLLEEGADPSVRDPRFDGGAASWAREFGHDALAARIEALASSGDATTEEL